MFFGQHTFKNRSGEAHHCLPGLVLHKSTACALFDLISGTSDRLALTKGKLDVCSARADHIAILRLSHLQPPVGSQYIHHLGTALAVFDEFDAYFTHVDCDELVHHLSSKAHGFRCLAQAHSVVGETCICLFRLDN